ncbi:hypothetical protein BDW60DRAFT_215892 [Aspergillus nidulans var. acristatus]
MQLLKRDLFHMGSRSLESCAGNLNPDGTNARAHRRALAQKRSMVEVLNISHLYEGDFIDPDRPASAFANEHHILLTPYGLRARRDDPWDMWNANATGVYRGVINEGNGDFTDDSNINNTFLRAVQQANQDGFFFDQALIDEVSKTDPYTENTYPVTDNALDDTFHRETAYSAFDPVFHYEYLGDTPEDRLLMWVRIGECTGDMNLGDLPGENGPGPAVYDSPPPSAWDNETDAAELSAAKSWLKEQNNVAAATQAP